MVKNYYTFLSVLTMVSLIGCKRNVEKSVQFIGSEPVIDGKLDKDLEYLQKRTFSHIWQFDNPVTDTIDVSYRLAYTPSHLYVYIEAEMDSINHRRRGFVRGDGFKLLLAKPHSDSLTNEYYDLVFSPSKDKDYWARKRIWEYNHDQSHNRPLGESTLFEASPNGKKVGFEALIAWEDIPPYHPWFMKSMGYNLYFAKAIGDTITNGYAVVADNGIWNEEVPKRNYKLLSYGKPKTLNEKAIRLQLKRRNITVGEPLEFQIASLGNTGIKVPLSIKTRHNGTTVGNQSVALEVSKDFSKHSFLLEVQNFEIGQYLISVELADKPIYESNFTILPDFDLAHMYEQVHTNPQGVSEGAKHTLLFKIKAYEKGLNDLKEYETAQDLLKKYEIGSMEFKQFMNGIDPYKTNKGPYRRAFFSELDSTYQPYSIKLPKNYDPNKKYPLLVFLHGSGSSDEGLLNAARSDGSFIEIAPYGRDKFRAYSSFKSQKDIVEAIEDASKYFPVDNDKIVIGGFSMGGYGALRTFYENPELYRGVVVHAGHPDLANYWLGNGFPNFLGLDYLKSLKEKKVFVYHGKQDGSLPVALIEQMVAKMKTIGVDVTAHIIEAKGHEYPDEATNEAYFQWLNEVIQ